MGIRFYVIPISDLGRASYISSVTCAFVYRFIQNFKDKNSPGHVSDKLEKNGEKSFSGSIS